LIIDTINFSEYKDLNSTLSSIIEQTNYTIPKLYQYLQENIHIFLSNDNISTCEFIQNNIDGIYESNKEFKELSILECNPQKISIIKHENIEKEIKKTYYKITMDNFDIINIMISNKEIENDINDSLKNINTNNITIAKII
jgi:predicted hydrocarbon binding protein